MEHKITTKDVSKKRIICAQGEKFNEEKALGLIQKIIVWLSERGVAVSDLPLVLVEENKSFQAAVPVKEIGLKLPATFESKILPAHRIGSLFHKNLHQPLELSEQFLERQLRYQGFQLFRPYRYIFHQDPTGEQKYFIEIQIPIHK